MIMNIVRNVGAMVLGLLPLVGCAQIGIELDDEPVGVALEPQTGGETSKPNGLDPDLAEGCAVAVLESMSIPLVTISNGVEIANPQIPADLLPGGECYKPFSYAVRCGLDAGDTLPGFDPTDLQGEAIVTGAGAWRESGPLTLAQQSSVLTCMTALMNTHTGVLVCLSGQGVNNGPPGACEGFDYDEAVFLTVPNAAGLGVVSHIWPMILPEVCDPKILADVYGRRVCGEPPQPGVTPACQAWVRDDYDQVCQETTEGIFCLGQPAIKTRLTDEGFETMYPECEPSPQ